MNKWEGEKGRGEEKEGEKEEEEEERKAEQEGRTGWLPSHLWEMLKMLRTAWLWLEVRYTCVPGCRRTALGLPVCCRNQFRLAVSWLRGVRFSMLPGVCSEVFKLRVPGTAGRQETGLDQELTALHAWLSAQCSWLL